MHEPRRLLESAFWNLAGVAPHLGRLYARKDPLMADIYVSVPIIQRQDEDIDNTEVIHIGIDGLGYDMDDRRVVDASPHAFTEVFVRVEGNVKTPCNMVSGSLRCLLGLSPCLLGLTRYSLGFSWHSLGSLHVSWRSLGSLHVSWVSLGSLSGLSMSLGTRMAHAHPGVPSSRRALLRRAWQHF